MPTVFYRDPDLVITDDVFAIWNPQPQIYDLEGLCDLRFERAGRPVRTEPAHTTMLAAGGSSSVATAIRVFTPPTWRLRARYAGADVTLFSASSVRSVRRVRRCLMRAFAANAESFDRLDRSAGYAEAYRRLNTLL